MIGSVFSFYGYFFTQGAESTAPNSVIAMKKYLVKIVIDEFDKI